MLVVENCVTSSPLMGYVIASNYGSMNTLVKLVPGKTECSKVDYDYAPGSGKFVSTTTFSEYKPESGVYAWPTAANSALLTIIIVAIVVKINARKRK
jgi:hypothetical protein